MPTYVYKFLDTDETIEVHQSFTDATLTEAVHPDTGETLPVKKVFLPVGVTFKGDGFYKTDSRASKKKSSTSSASSSSSDSSSDSSSSSSSEKSSSTESKSSSGSSKDSGGGAKSDGSSSSSKSSSD